MITVDITDHANYRQYLILNIPVSPTAELIGNRSPFNLALKHYSIIRSNDLLFPDRLMIPNLGDRRFSVPTPQGNLPSYQKWRS